ncbi:hypothetical protein [Parasitella parasitica]|uniref:Uncharacterized protein n=1 Tax=Parasitella parasitica TaxID=35722 RepID=A0A0B7NBM8_9FUNG|nr:hypothetical protein [Parasitella parasitica]
MRDADVSRHDSFSEDDHLTKDETDKENTGVPRRRITQFVNIVRSAMFSKQYVTEAYLQDQDEQITAQEFTTIINISSFIRPYIPSRKRIISVLILSSLSSWPTKLYGSIGHFKLSHKSAEAEDKSSHHADDDQLQITAFRGLKKVWRAKFEHQQKLLVLQRVQKTKLQKRELMVAVRDTKEHTQSLKQEIRAYGKLLVDYMKDLIPFKHFVVGSKECRGSVQEYRMDEDVGWQTAVFSGTHNGIMKITEIVFQIFDDVKDVEDSDDLDRDDADVPKTHSNLPRALTLAPKQIYQETGLATVTNSLNRRKRTTAEELRVIEIEETLVLNGQ